MEIGKETKEEMGKKRRREEEKEENETESVKRRCVGSVSVEAFEIFSQGGDMESCGDVSWERLLEEPEDRSDREPVSCELVRVVPDVIDVPVFPSSVVTELCDGFFFFARIGNVWNRSPSLSPRNVFTLGQ